MANRPQRGTANRGGNGKPKSTSEKVFSVLIPTGKGESVLGTVWRRSGESNGQAYTVDSVQVQSSYYSQDDKEWKYGSSFKAGQLAALSYVLRRCEDFLFDAKDINSENPDADIPD